MNLKSFLRGPETDGSSAGGGGTDAAATSTAPDTSPKGIFGTSEAPEWVKAIPGLEKTHTATATPAKVESTTPDPVAQTPAVQTPAVQQTPPMDAAAIAKAVAEGMRGVLPQQQPQQTAQPNLSQEQIEQQLGVYKMNAKDYEEAYGVKPTDQQLAAHNRILQAVAKQAVTMATVMQQNSLQQFHGQLNPYITAVRAAEAEKQKTIFFTDNKDLVGYDALVAKEYAALKSSGTKFASVEEARKAVADNVRATLKSIGVTPNGPAAATTSTNKPQTTNSPTSSRQMTTTQIGGRGGSSATPTKPASKIEAVWGNK